MNYPEDKVLPYGRQSITEEDINAVVAALRGPLITQGPLVTTFEEKVADKVKAKHSVATNSATSALHLACMALELGEGDRLWTTPTTFVASANCGRYCRAEIDFVDIEANTGLMSMKKLSKKLELAEQKNELPKIIVPVHLCGSSCDMKTISELAKRYGFYVIEDASHAIGGKYKEEPVGSCKYSDITVFSFHPVKVITTGEGGMATTNQQKLATKMRDLRSHGITKDIDQFEEPAAGPWSYEQQDLGFNYRMTDIQAALGLSQLSRLEKIVEERNKQLKKYGELLEGMQVKLLSVPDGILSSVHLGVIRLSNMSPGEHRRVFEGMRAAGIGVQLHYAPVHLQPYYKKKGFRKGDFPEAEEYATNAMSLPLYPGLQVEEQEHVIDILSRLLEQ